MHGLAGLGIAPHPGLAVFHLKRPESNQLNFSLGANAIGDRTQNNPLSPPCMTPNPGFHDPSAKSKFLAASSFNEHVSLP